MSWTTYMSSIVSLDMREAFLQTLPDRESRDITTFSDGLTLYRFTRLPFGLSWCPAIFPRRVTSVLSLLLHKGWPTNYFDDLILWDSSFSLLLEWLEQLFNLPSADEVKLILRTRFSVLLEHFEQIFDLLTADGVKLILSRWNLSLKNSHFLDMKF